MLQALPYHKKVVEFFKNQPKTWDYFASAKTKNEQLSKFKLDLLKNSYKFSEYTDKEIYEKVSLAKEKLGLGNLPVQVYQAQYDEEKNASIVFIEGEAHIVFSGRITQLLNDEELLAVIAHELTHIKLYTMLDGEPEIADRIITAIANNYGAEAAHFETARIFRLYTEIFCDRGSFTVLEKTEPIITSLVKIATGLEKVSYDSYVKQAEEIFSAENSLKSANITHPENFIRARAIHLWHNSPNEAEAEIVKMIEGTTDLDALDIFKQREITQFTQRFLQLFLKPKWFQSVLVLSQARQYFKDFKLDETAVLTEEFTTSIEKAHESVKNYLAYLLLDFVLVDGSLEDVPYGWAFQFAEDIYLKDVFDSIIKKELQLSDKRLAQQKKKTLAAYYEVKESAAEQIYEE